MIFTIDLDGSGQDVVFLAQAQIDRSAYWWNVYVCKDKRFVTSDLCVSLDFKSMIFVPRSEHGRLHMLDYSSLDNSRPGGSTLLTEYAVEGTTVVERKVAVLKFDADNPDASDTCYDLFYRRSGGKRDPVIETVRNIVKNGTKDFLKQVEDKFDRMK
jgi:hypothetical protein